MTQQKRGRDTGNGHFIAVDEARNRRGAVVETVAKGGKPTKRKRGRDTVSGEFVAVDEARRLGADGVVETVRTRR